MKTNKDTAVAYAVLLVYALAGGFSFICSKTAVALATPLQTLSVRFTIAFLGAVAMLASGKFHFCLKGPHKGQLALAVGGYVGFLGIQAWGLLFTTSIVSGILFAAVPVLARLVAGVVLKEGSTWVQNAFAALSVGSVIAMCVIGSVDSRGSVSVPGFLILLLASISYAVGNVYMRVVKPYYSPFTISFCSCTVGFLAFGGAALVRCLLKGGWGAFFAPVGDVRFLGSVAYLGIVCTLITGALISFALRTLPALSATIFGNLSTAISVVAGPLILGEPLYGYQIVCTVLIAVGVLGISIFTGRQAGKGGQPAPKEEGAQE